MLKENDSKKLDMRKTISGILFMVALLTSYGQGTIESLFDKYAGNKGFTSVTISGDLLKLARAMRDRESSGVYLPGEITSVRILVQTGNNRPDENFYDLIKKGPERRKYREFMSVKESGRNLVMLTRSSRRVFREVLIIGGGDNGLLVQIKGNMTFKEAKEFSERLKKDGGRGIWSYVYG